VTVVGPHCSPVGLVDDVEDRCLDHPLGPLGIDQRLLETRRIEPREFVRRHQHHRRRHVIDRTQRV
jgi:hypothetical protein